MPVIFKDTVSHFKKNLNFRREDPKKLVSSAQIFLNRPFIDVIH